MERAATSQYDKVKVIISDCHLSAGRFYEGRVNPHEDFHFDREMVEMFEYFSSGPKYGENEKGPVDVELIINGDYLDFLNVPFEGEFEEAITEEIALHKCNAILKGHTTVMQAIRKFASLPNKRVTYLIGNHDGELFFESVRKRITEEWDPNGQYPSEKVKVIADRDHLSYPEGVEIHHGNQFESGNEFDFEKPFLKTNTGKSILNIPWGSVYVLKIVNRMKWEREYLDKIRPVKVFVLIGLFTDPIFTVKFVFLSLFYFFKVRLSPHGRRTTWKQTLALLKQEGKVFQDLESEARALLDEKEKVHTIIFGHTHRPMHKVYPDGKQYLNTGTWTKMIDLDWSQVGSPIRRTFAILVFRDGEVRAELRQWVGEAGPHQAFNG